MCAKKITKIYLSDNFQKDDLLELGKNYIFHNFEKKLIFAILK